MKRLALLFVVLPAMAQDESGKDGLLLVSRTVDLRIRENLAVARVTYKVQNPTEKALEGDVRFDVPPGAAVCEATLLKHIASTERRSKILNPDDALTLYTAVKNRDLNDQEKKKLDLLLAFTQTNGTTVGDTTSMVQEILIRTRGSRNNTTSRPTAPTRTDTPTNPTRPTHRDLTPPTRPPDPALVEHISGDSYRLRFFPVPAKDDQTVSFVMAWEVPADGDQLVARIPMTHRTNFENKAGKHAVTVSLKSGLPIAKASCTTHFLTAKGSTSATCLEATADGSETDREFVLRFVLDGTAKLHDFGRRLDWRELKPRAKEMTLEEAVRSVIGRKTLDQGSHDTGTARLISLSANIVSQWASLLVIERAVAEEVKNTPVKAEISDTDVRDCDVMRHFAKLSSRKHKSPCEILKITTSDPDKLAYAREHGIETKESNGSVTYEYAKHRGACMLTEPNVGTLKTAAEGVK